MKAVRTWILIADGGAARTFLNRGPGKGIEAIPGMTLEAETLPTRDIMADKPGRSFESSGNMRHGMEYRSDPHREQKKDFARDIAEKLEAHLDDFDRLVIVAAATTLGDLRAVLSDAVKSKVTGELAKDLTHMAPNELPDHLGELLPL